MKRHQDENENYDNIDEDGRIGQLIDRDERIGQISDNSDHTAFSSIDSELNLPVEFASDKMRRLLVHEDGEEKDPAMTENLVSITEDKKVLTYHSATNRWQHNQDVPDWFDGGTVCCSVSYPGVVRGVVAVGSQDNGRYLPNVCLMDIDKKSAKTLPDLPKGVWGPGVHCTHDGDVYVVGGSNSKSAYRLCLDDIISDSDGSSGGGWYQLPDMKEEAQWPIMASDAEQVYTISGKKDPVYAFDIKESTWSKHMMISNDVYDDAVEYDNLYHGAVYYEDYIHLFSNEWFERFRRFDYLGCNHDIKGVNSINPVVYQGQLMVYVRHASKAQWAPILYTWEHQSHEESGIDVSKCGNTWRFFAV